MNTWFILFIVSFLVNVFLLFIFLRERFQSKEKYEIILGEKSRADRATKFYFKLGHNLEEVTRERDTLREKLEHLENAFDDDLK